MSRLQAFCDSFIEAGWLAAIAAAPLYFNVFSNRVFEPDKMIVVRCLAILMALAYIVGRFEAAGRWSSLGRDWLGRDGRLVTSLRVFGRDPILLAASALLVGSGVSTLLSVVPGTSLWGSYQRLQGYYGLFSFVIIFLLVRRGSRHEGRVHRILSTVILVSIPVSVYGIMQSMRLDPLPWSGDTSVRVTSTLGNAIFLSAYLIMAMPLVFTRMVGIVRRLVSATKPIPAESAPWSQWSSIAIYAVMVVADVAIFIGYIVFAASNSSVWWAALPVVLLFAGLTLLLPRVRGTTIGLYCGLVGLTAVFAVQATAIILSQSRGPWVGLGAAFAVVAVMGSFLSRLRWAKVATLAAVVLAIGILVAGNIPGNPVQEVLRPLPYVGRLTNLLETEGGTGRVRLLIWRGVGELMTTRPGVGLAADPLRDVRPAFGYGPESLYVTYNKVYQPELANIEARTASPDRSHNDLLDYWSQTGALGLITYLALFGALMVVGWRLMRRHQDAGMRLAVVGITGALAGHFVESQFGIVIAATRMQFWVYAGILAGLYGVSRCAFGGTATSEETGEGPAQDAAAVGDRMTRGTEAAGRGPTRQRGAKSVRGPRKRGGALTADSRRIQGASAASTRTPLTIPARLWIPIGLAVLSLIGLAILARVAQATDPMFMLMLGLAWAFVWLLAMGVLLYSGEVTRLLTVANAPIYTALLAVAWLLCYLNVQVVAADVYYKRGLGEDERAQTAMVAGQTVNSSTSRIEAISAYRKAINLAGDQDFYYLFLGRSYIELTGTASNTGTATPTALSLQDALTASARELGTLSKAQVMDLARLVLEEAYRLAPLNTDHSANLARMYRNWSEISADASKLDSASSYYRQALLLSPRSALLLTEWAQVDLMRGDIQAGLAHLKAAAGLDVNYTPAFVLLGDVYQYLEQAEDALREHSHALILEPAALSDARFNQRVQWYLDHGLAGTLDELYAKAAASAPASAVVRGSYGLLLARMGQYQRAAAEFEAQIRLSPADWGAQRNLAFVYASLGRNGEALATAEGALKLAPKNAIGVQELQDLVTQLRSSGSR